MRVLVVTLLLAAGAFAWLWLRQPSEEVHMEGPAVQFGTEEPVQEEMVISGTYSPEHVSFRPEALGSLFRGSGPFRAVWVTPAQLDVDVFWDGTSLTGGSGVRGEFHQQRMHAVVRGETAVTPFTVILHEDGSSAVVQHTLESGDTVETAVPAENEEAGASLIEEILGTTPHEHE